MRKLMTALGIVTLVIMLLAVMASPMWNGNRVLAASTRPVTTAVSLPGAVQLEWTEAGNPGVAGYFIRRGPASGEEDRWPINDFPVVGTAYVDRNVTPGTTYYYTVFPLLTDGTLAFGSFEVVGTSGEIPAGYRPPQSQMEAPAVVLVTADGPTTASLQHQPITDLGRVLLSMEDLKALTGADLSYDEATGVITHTLPSGRIMQMKLGEPRLTFRKAERRDICSPVEREGVVYLPVRWIVESMEGTVTFDTPNNQVIIHMTPAE